MRRVTMEDIAQKAGVSRMTVSLALRNHSRISEKTRKQVQAIAEEMGYRPNPFVSSLMARLRHNRRVTPEADLAFITSHSTRDGWQQHGTTLAYYEGAKQRAEQLGFRMGVWWAREPGYTPKRLSQIFHTRNILGLLIAPMPNPHDTIELDWSKFATVALGYSFEHPQFHRVANDQYQTVRLALKRLQELGYQRIGLVLPRFVDERTNNHWSAAYYTHYHSCKPSHRIPPLLEDEELEKRFGAWMKKYKPEAVLSVISEMGNWLKRLGYSIPQDVAFASLATSSRDQKVAGIDQSSARVGASAVDLVVQQLYASDIGLPEIPQVVMIEGKWTEGGSISATGPKTT